MVFGPANGQKYNRELDGLDTVNRYHKSMWRCTKWMCAHAELNFTATRGSIMKTCILCGMVLFLIMPVSNADSMRCGNKLVSINDTKAEILIKCGAPLTQETIAIEEKTEFAELALKYPLLYKHGLLKDDKGVTLGKENSVTRSIDQWTYHLGEGKFLRILYFEGGRLAAIEEGDRM